MGILAAILGGVAGLLTVMGIVTALEVIPAVMPQLDWMFWFVLSAVLFLASIASSIGRSSED